MTLATTAVCCCCRRESACRYDCLCFLVILSSSLHINTKAHAHTLLTDPGAVYVSKLLRVMLKKDAEPVPQILIEEAACVHVAMVKCRSANFDPPSVCIPTNRSVSISRQAQVKVVIYTRINNIVTSSDVHMQNEATMHHDESTIIRKLHFFTTNCFSCLRCLSASALLI